jgi:hypothetical protein
MKKKTAVEWLVRKINNELIGEIPMHRWDEIREIVQQAKAMEKEQIITAYYQGDYNSDIYPTAEQYYNQTYNTDTQ